MRHIPPVFDIPSAHLRQLFVSRSDHHFSKEGRGEGGGLIDRLGGAISSSGGAMNIWEGAIDVSWETISRFRETLNDLRGGRSHHTSHIFHVLL